ncbi:MAG TPA: hypothetical protein DEB24_00430 [Coriobacteriia bacterium]|nr:hypothetical protein [Coriobacteriia bacterium]
MKIGSRAGKVTGVAVVAVLAGVIVAVLASMYRGEAAMSESAVLSAPRAVIERKATGLSASFTSESGKETTVERSGVSVPSMNCPLRLPDCEELRHSRGTGTESWRTVVDAGCREYAEALLIQLRDDGFLLAQSGYMDLYGQAWGCTVKNAEDDVYIITLIPDKVGANRNSDNGLQVNVVHVFEPKFQ